MKYFNMKKYKIYITDVAMSKMNAYIAIAPMEISGLGTIKEHEGSYIIDDIFLIKQECTSAYTELDQGKVIEFMTDKINNGEEDTVNRLRVWWHSHVNMGTFWSGTDRNTIDSFNSSDVWISVVGTKNGDKLVSVDYYDPRICFDNSPLEVVKTNQDLTEIWNNCKKEVEEKVKFNRHSFVEKTKEKSALKEVEKIMEDLGVNNE